jgi:hypothetical protein
MQRKGSDALVTTCHTLRAVVCLDLTRVPCNEPPPSDAKHGQLSSVMSIVTIRVCIFTNKHAFILMAVSGAERRVPQQPRALLGPLQLPCHLRVHRAIKRR